MLGRWMDLRTNQEPGLLLGGQGREYLGYRHLVLLSYPEIKVNEKRKTSPQTSLACIWYSCAPEGPTVFGGLVLGGKSFNNWSLEEDLRSLENRAQKASVYSPEGKLRGHFSLSFIGLVHTSKIGPPAKKTGVSPSLCPKCWVCNSALTRLA
jgi:hypothetical protein